MSSPSIPNSLIFADLSTEVVLVTGSSSGIGRAIALELGRAGATVGVHCAQSVAAATSVVAEIQRNGGIASLFQADLSTSEGCLKLTKACELASFVPTGLVNNAGADLLTGEPASWGFAEKLQRLFDVDVRSTLLLSKHFGQQMSERGRGVIINIGWDQADRGMEGASGELFATSKNAIMGFTRSLSVSLAPNVRVNCIAPGWIKTAWGEVAGQTWQDRVIRETPLARWGLPEDIAKLARFLLSNDAAYITGQVINANGGAIR
jgi:3-oxoacyl-[acyl-carrier protein] reductase